MRRFRLAGIALAVAALAAMALGTAADAKKSAVSGDVSIVGIWTGPEQKRFQAVLDGFKKLYPDVNVKYTSAGDNTPTVLSTAIQGGNPPDLASIAQPGLLKDFARQGALKPITFARGSIARNFAGDWLKLGTVNGKLYGLFFKGANKATVWYSVAAFKNAGIRTPKSWPALLTAAKTLKASGTPAFSIGGADGWTLTDLFENIYLRQAGPALYDRLATHSIKWTHPSVKAALRTMASVFTDSSNIYGGTSGALQTDFPTSVNNVFSKPAKGAMVLEGDFVPGVATTKATAIKDYNVFQFPSVGGSAPSVVGGGDIVVMFKDTPASRALVTFLSTPAAATIAARYAGGYSSPNKNVKPGAYKDPLNRATAIQLAHARTFRFDLSDLQPSAFGGTVGQGLFKLFQDFLKSPQNVNGIASQMEAAAAKAYK
jgi:ABC-type glycerol-3-phosphate transport system substrate-binding protein